MAPLLGRKPFPLAKPLPPGEPGELFVIPHTQEAFRTREYPPHRGAGGVGAGPGAVEPNKAVVGSGGERDREESAAGAALDSAGSLFPEAFPSLFQAGGGCGTATPRGWSGRGAELTGTVKAGCESNSRTPGAGADIGVPRARSTLVLETYAVLNF